MIASTLVSLALSLTLGQAQPAPHGEAGDPHAAPAGPHAAPADPHATPADPHATPAAGQAAPVEAATAGHEAATGHEAPAGHQAAAGEHGGGGHEESLGAVMMHHVADGYLVEFPGICHGGPAWNCEWNLRETFGDSLKFGAVDMTPTKHVVMMWLASALLLLVVLPAVRKRSLVPRGLYNFVELLVAFVRNEIAVPNIGKADADRFLPYLLSVFFFILFVNIFGLLPFAATATANLSVTVCLAICTFLITQYAAIKAQGIGGFLKHLTGGVHWLLWPLMVPVEILGLFTKPFALTVRLFANMVAGHFVILALLGLIYAVSFWIFPVAVALALGIFMLELFVALVQAYIFTLLSALFIGTGVVAHGHDEGHGDEAHGHASHAAEHH